MRTFCIGDIHGELQALLELLNKVNFDYENDKLISLGDLCDRGQYTWEVYEVFLKIKNLIFVKGNHDYCFEQYLKGNPDYIYDWGLGIGENTIRSYVDHNWENIENHKKLLLSALPYWIENNICYVHGGFNRYRSIKNQSEYYLSHDRDLMSDVMNNKDEKIYTFDNFDRIFIGHTPTICWNVGDEKLNGELNIVYKIENPIYYPIIKSGVYNLDTGCGKGGYLTIYDIDTYFQSKEKY